MDNSIDSFLLDTEVHQNLTVLCDVSRWGTSGEVKFGANEYQRVKSFKRHSQSLCALVLRGWTNPKMQWAVYGLPGEGMMEWFQGFLESLSSITLHQNKWLERCLTSALGATNLDYRRRSGASLLEDLVEVGKDTSQYFYLGMPSGRISTTTLQGLLGYVWTQVRV